MALARSNAPLTPDMADALARLLAGDGSPLPIEVDGRPVAWLLTPAELERLEDERDLAILRAGRAEAELSGEPFVSLEEIVARHGIDLARD